jgi:hypothetical protein
VSVRSVIAFALMLSPLGVLGMLGGTGSLAQEVTPAPARPPSFDRVPTEAEDAALYHTVIRIINDDLQLPVGGVTIETLDAATFDQVLENQRLRTEDRVELEGAIGVALGSRILIRADQIAQMTIAARAQLYAHELTHAAQARLGNGAPRVTWLVEGHADWVAFQVSERLGHRAYAASRDRVRRRVRAAPLPRAKFPMLSDLETSERWHRLTNQAGWAATYGQALLAVDQLVERYSAATLREYIGRSNESDRRLRAIDSRSAFAGVFAQRDWNAVFPVEYRQFVTEFRSYLETLH